MVGVNIFMERSGGVSQGLKYTTILQTFSASSWNYGT